MLTRLRRATGVALALACLAAAGCGGAQPLVLRVSPEVKRPEKSVVLFFGDGMDERVMDRMLAAGELPNIKRVFVEGGVRVRNAIGCIPAMTYPNTVALLTGRFPGHTGVTANQRFDRSDLSWTDYITAEAYQRVNQDFHCPTIFETLPEYFTISVQCPTHRGATHSFDNQIETGFGWWLGIHISVDAFVGSCIELVGPAADRVGRWPELITFYFPGLDETAHQYGPDSDLYRQAMVNIDTQVRRVTDALESADLLDRTCLVIVSDHGQLSSRDMRTFDLVAWIAKTRALRIHGGPIPGVDYISRREALDGIDVVAVDGAHRRLAFHLRGPADWKRRPSDDEIARFLDPDGPDGPKPALADLSCVELVCVRDGRDAVRVLSPRGAARIERRVGDSTTLYRIDPPRPGSDPLKLLDDPALAAFAAEGWHASRRWLTATATGEHPDFVPQIAEFFDAANAGDVVVFAAEEYVLATATLGVHGSCRAEDLRIPLFFAGTDMPRGATIEVGRIVDVMPTIVEWLDGAERAGELTFDGRSLLQELRAAD
jgi:arylsulfatase A-like enzyme